MKKTLLALTVATTLLSCNKETIAPTTQQATTTVDDCDCGVIDQINTVITDSIYYNSIIYNECTGNDTTVYYIPQTNSGQDKQMGDYHCLGIKW